MLSLGAGSEALIQALLSLKMERFDTDITTLGIDLAKNVFQLYVYGALVIRLSHLAFPEPMSRYGHYFILFY
jgi:hypothetical protein